MIFLNNHVLGISWLISVEMSIRFYPPCLYNRENIAARVFEDILNNYYCVRISVARSLGL